MTNLFKTVLLGLTLLINLAYSQTDMGRKVACYTTSCCSFGFFDVDLISTTHCHYITVSRDGSQQNSYTSTFTSNEPIKDGIVKVDEDIIMPQFKDERGEALVLPKGEYIIKNNQIQYGLAKIRHNAACWSEHVTGTILGHSVNYTVTLCVFYPTINRSAKASVSMKFELTESQREEIRKNNNIITFKENILVNKDDVEYTIKAGDYFLNENDEIYIINSSIK